MGTRNAKTATGSRSVHRMKVTLWGTSPPVWRRLVVPSSTTLGSLHHMLQCAMGWEDCPLHEFSVADTRYGPRSDFLDDGWGTPPKDEATAKLSRVAPAGARLVYDYDFGDSWRHEIVVEKVEKVPAGALGAERPVCISGRRAGPPEDCGGVWGYEHLLAVLADPEHEEHEELVEWLGGDHDPEHFDPADVNRMLDRYSRVRTLSLRR